MNNISIKYSRKPFFSKFFPKLAVNTLLEKTKQRMNQSPFINIPRAQQDKKVVKTTITPPQRPQTVRSAPQQNVRQYVAVFYLMKSHMDSFLIAKDIAKILKEIPSLANQVSCIDLDKVTIPQFRSIDPKTQSLLVPENLPIIDFQNTIYMKLDCFEWLLLMAKKHRAAPDLIKALEDYIYQVQNQTSIEQTVNDFDFDSVPDARPKENPKAYLADEDYQRQQSHMIKQSDGTDKQEKIQRDFIDPKYEPYQGGQETQPYLTQTLKSKVENFKSVIAIPPSPNGTNDDAYNSQYIQNIDDSNLLKTPWMRKRGQTPISGVEPSVEKEDIANKYKTTSQQLSAIQRIQMWEKENGSLKTPLKTKLPTRPEEFNLTSEAEFRKNVQNEMKVNPTLKDSNRTEPSFKFGNIERKSIPNIPSFK
jgi:hypothetical protein